MVCGCPKTPVFDVPLLDEGLAKLANATAPSPSEVWFKNFRRE